MRAEQVREQAQVPERQVLQELQVAARQRVSAPRGRAVRQEPQRLVAPEPAGWSRALREQVWPQERVQRVRVLPGLRVQL